MSTVTVFVTSPDTRSERRFDLHTPIGQLKTKLELITGVPVANQRIELLDKEGDDKAVNVLAEDERPLGYYSVRDFQVLKIVDTNPSTSFTGQLTDVSQVEKFELTEEEYAARRDSVLAYKQAHKFGRFAPAETAAHEQVHTANVDIPVGARCEVESGDAELKKRGTVRFVGTTGFAKGVWVGIEYDEPMGKNDGSVQGQRYFECKPNYGAFVRPEKVTVGDFPEEDLLEEM